MPNARILHLVPTAGHELALLGTRIDASPAPKSARSRSEADNGTRGSSATRRADRDETGSDNDVTAVDIALVGGDRYEALRRKAVALCDAGDLHRALEVYTRALDEATRGDDEDRVDRALCNQLAVAISLGDHQEVRKPLREVLSRRTSEGSAFLAADGLSRAYAGSKDYKKGLFYAQVSRGHAQATENLEWLASSFNQEGNCLTAESHFGRAVVAYRRALDLLPSTPSPSRAGVALNLGYCESMVGRADVAFRLAFDSLRCFRRFGYVRGCGWAHLDLCHAYTQRERAQRAVLHGRRALRYADQTGDVSLTKNSLFMLGEAEQQAGDLDQAFQCFDRLQRTFYPDQPQLVELLLAVDLRQMVNLRA